MTRPREASQRFWKQAEDDLVIALYLTDKPQLLRLLPHRSALGIRKRANDVLNLSGRKWITNIQERQIRELAKTCFRYVDIAAIVNINPPTIRSFMCRSKLKLAKRELVLTGNKMYDEIRAKIKERKMSLRDFDRSLKYKGDFFSKTGSVNIISPGMMYDAVKALGGRLVVKWDDEQ
ncbi:hypothetical protein [Phyllobacterium calauticae]|jgi:hypothetical protein|uniref:hypothetical protein n=1 Tax=Phyllobacterium calauticae TaxID=2817027 RepID=UPI001CBDB50B|nr:hypothetical protein [Phyllobacterium calauticae]MBZ3693264.1 hypothetical protein [Phyllobacterium calauticae]